LIQFNNIATKRFVHRYVWNSKIIKNKPGISFAS